MAPVYLFMQGFFFNPNSTLLILIFGKVMIIFVKKVKLWKEKIL